MLDRRSKHMLAGAGPTVPAQGGVMNPSAQLAGRFIDWGVVQISVANLVVIAVMIVLFVLALVVPFPRSRAEKTEDRDDQA
jgi:hypothetical protein